MARGIYFFFLHTVLLMTYPSPSPPSPLPLLSHLCMKFFSCEADPFVWRTVSIDFEVDQSSFTEGHMFASSMSSAVASEFLLLGTPHELLKSPGTERCQGRADR